MDALNLNHIEVDCLQYVAGAVARKFIGKYPELGKKSQMSKDGLNCNWTEYVSEGNLLEPLDMIQCGRFIEMVFREYHGTKGINKEPGIMDKVSNKVTLLLKNRYNIPKDVLHCMVRTRTFIRLNHLNKIIQEKQTIKNKKSKTNKFKK